MKLQTGESNKNRFSVKVEDRWIVLVCHREPRLQHTRNSWYLYLHLSSNRGTCVGDNVVRITGVVGNLNLRHGMAFTIDYVPMSIK